MMEGGGGAGGLENGTAISCKKGSPHFQAPFPPGTVAYSLVPRPIQEGPGIHCWPEAEVLAA